MGSRVLLAAAAALVLVAAAALLAYDASRGDRVADGITVAGVDVGGMSEAQARDALRSRLAHAFSEPVAARWHDRTWRLGVERAGAQLDAAATARAAVQRGRRSNPFGRALRDLTGGSVDAEVAPVVRVDRDAVGRWVRGVAKDVDRPARDADIDMVGFKVRKQPSRNGLAVQRAALRDGIMRALRSPGPDPAVGVEAKVDERPDKTLDEIAKKYPALITISRARKQLRLYRHLKLVKTYEVAVGKAGNETPAGRYAIQNKEKNPAWHAPDSAWAGELAGQVIPPGDPRNPLKARWMGFYDGAGIHGTGDPGSVGTNASHGCIRMRIPEVIELYEKVPVKTPVFIA